MNNVVISLGCSWTYGYGLKDNETYSAHLQKLFPSYKFVNAGHCGADIDYAIFSGVKTIEEYNPRAVIFQITSFDRVTIGTDGFENFLKNKTDLSYNSDLYYGDSDKNNLRLIGINDNVKTKYTHGSYLSSNKSRKEEFAHAKMNRVDTKKYKNFVDTLYENVVYSDYELDKKINNLFLFKKYLESKNIKSLWFCWTGSYSNQIFLKNFFEKEIFIENAVVDWLNEYYVGQNFYIDSGYHLSSIGNQLLAEKYLSPCIKKIL